MVVLLLKYNSGLKIDSTQHPLHTHNDGLTQRIVTNNNFPMAMGNSGHALSMHSEIPSNTYNHNNARLFSDLMKITVVIGSLSLKQSNVLYKRKTLPGYGSKFFYWEYFW